MKEFLRPAIVLVVICLVAAAVLAPVHDLTARVIEERQEAEFKEALSEFFPEVANYEQQEIEEGRMATLVYDGSGDKLGVVAEAVAQGFGGPIIYNLYVDNEGTIVGLRIIEHLETPGLGSRITEPEYQDQVIGKNFDDPIALGEDVDALSGATITSRAITTSIRQTMDYIGANFLGKEVEQAPAVTVADVADGTYEGSAPGFKGDITVKVTVSGGVITEVEVLSHSDTPDRFDSAASTVIPQLQQAEVVSEDTIDAQSGATFSSKGIVNAVINALSAGQ